MMPTKIDIISGVLGVGKTTLINHILKGVLKTDSIAIIENEFGEIGIDGHRFAASGVTVREISGGCICCSLFGDFVSATRKLISQVRPDRIIVEPTGIGKLSDVLKAIEAVGKVETIEINMVIAVVDSLRYELYSKMFGDFYKDQIQTANTIFLSRTQLASKESIDNAIDHLKNQNRNANIIAQPWDELTGAEIISIGEEKNKFVCIAAFEHYKDATHHHHSGEEFKAWSTYTSARYSMEQFREIIKTLENESRCGDVVRGKGFFQTPEGVWLQYDYIPKEIRFRKADHMDTGEIVFIGKNLNPSDLEDLLSSSEAKGVFK
jgi:G3E family GTPase